jgi:hypothetical protein
MKAIVYILTITAAVAFSAACEHAHPGGYEAPSGKNENGGSKENIVVQIDSSVEKAIANDTTKRVYNL